MYIYIYTNTQRVNKTQVGASSLRGDRIVIIMWWSLFILTYVCVYIYVTHSHRGMTSLRPMPSERETKLKSAPAT